MHSTLAHSFTVSAPRRTAEAVNCAVARRVLAAATGVSADLIFAPTRIEDIVSDSLVMEVVVLELEEYFGCDADRTALWGLETVEDLARHMRDMKATAKV